MCPSLTDNFISEYRPIMLLAPINAVSDNLYGMGANQE